MKKCLLLISSLISIVVLATLPMACSHDDDDSDSNPTPEVFKEVKTFTGTLLYGQFSASNAKVSIKQVGENITLSLENTQIPYLSPEFKDVNINVSGDTSYFRAQSETIDAGSDLQLILTLNGMMFNDCETLYMTVTGSGMTDTLYFATDVKMLPSRGTGGSNTVIVPDVRDTLTLDFDYLIGGNGNGNVKLDLFGSWEGAVKYDGVESGTIAFTTSMGAEGLVIDLGRCKFSEKAPEMDIVLNNIMLYINEPSNIMLKGTSADYKLGGLSGKLDADINGSYSEESGISLGLGITVMKKDHTIEIVDAKRK